MCGRVWIKMSFNESTQDDERCYELWCWEHVDWTRASWKWSNQIYPINPHPTLTTRGWFCYCGSIQFELARGVCACVSAYVFSFVSTHTEAETPRALELWYLTPLSLHTSTCAPFIFRGGRCLVARSSRVPEDFNEKDIAQTPSMFPPCVHHRPADSWHGRTPPGWPQRRIHPQASAFEHNPTMLTRGSKGGGIRARRLVVGRPANRRDLKVERIWHVDICLWPPRPICRTPSGCYAVEGFNGAF